MQVFRGMVFLHRRTTFIMAALIGASLLATAHAEDASNLKPGPPPAGFTRQMTLSFDVQSDVDNSFTQKLARAVYKHEMAMYKLFRLSPGFLRGNDPKTKLDKRFPIAGDILAKSGFRPWIELRVYKTYEGFQDEYFLESDRMFEKVNKVKKPNETPEQRAIRRLTEGVPGAYYMRMTDYDDRFLERRIRAYVGDKTFEEVEGDLLHEMGHLFLETFLMVFGSAQKKGKESTKQGTPAWISEGVAQLFEVNWSSSKESKKKKRQYSAFIYEAVKANDHYPFGTFINVTNAHNLQAVASDPLKSTINYAQSYSVMQFMVERNWQKFLSFLENCRWENFQKRQKTRNAVSEIYSVQDKAFRDAWNNISIVQVEEYWKKFVIEETEKKFKSDPTMYYWAGEYFIRKKDLGTAEARFKLAQEGAPDQYHGYLGLGRVALSKNDDKGALENLLKATKISPKEEDPWYYLGYAQLRNNKSADAAVSFQKAVDLYPHFHQAWDGLGDALMKERKYKEAMVAYQKAYEIGKFPQGLLALGRASFYAKSYDDAQRNFAAFSNIFKMDPRGHFWYGMAAWRLGQKDYAAKKFQEALKLQPNDRTYNQAMQMLKKNQMVVFPGETPDGKVPAAGAGGKPAEQGNAEDKFEEEEE